MIKDVPLKEIAQRAGVSVSTLYHYCKKRLLPKPIRIPNEKAGRGVLAVYPETIIKDILRIKKQLRGIHSLEKIRQNNSMPEKETKKIIIKKINILLTMYEKGKCNEEIFKRRLSDICNFIGTSYLTYTLNKKPNVGWTFANSKRPARLSSTIIENEGREEEYNFS